MNGKRTAIVLGAGASYCYEDGRSRLPTQADIIGRLFFGASTSSGEGYPGFVGPDGIMHDFELGQFLRQHFEIPEDPSRETAKMDFWTALQKRFTLETLYDHLEQEIGRSRPHLLRRFEGIIRTAIRAPIGDRGPPSVCRFHRMICEGLEPGDYVIDFNWDSLMADALLYHSAFWFPRTGFGFPAAALLHPGQKDHSFQSAVHLYHVHGSVVLFQPADDEFRGKIVYLGPQQYNEMSAFIGISGIDMSKPADQRVPTRTPTEEEQERAALGFLFLKDRWYSPIFVTPSHDKPINGSTYLVGMRVGIHSSLPSTDEIRILGYSFPPADAEHLRMIFPRAVIRPDTHIVIVNPENRNEPFRERVRQIFPNFADIDFSQEDFREAARAAATPWNRFLRPADFGSATVDP
jgi:hypothetical protein